MERQQLESYPGTGWQRRNILHCTRDPLIPSAETVDDIALPWKPKLQKQMPLMLFCFVGCRGALRAHQWSRADLREQAICMRLECKAVAFHALPLLVLQRAVASLGSNSYPGRQCGDE